jgi:ketopantoate reductase
MKVCIVGAGAIGGFIGTKLAAAGRAELSAVAHDIAPLLGPQTVVLPAMNGVPWWFCHGLVGFPGGALQSVDSGGTIGAAVPFDQVLGCVVHASTSTPEPGLVQHSQLQAGMVMVNAPTAGVDPHVPFGGRKGSSHGSREQGRYAAESFTTVKTAYVRA